MFKPNTYWRSRYGKYFKVIGVVLEDIWECQYNSNRYNRVYNNSDTQVTKAEYDLNKIK